MLVNDKKQLIAGLYTDASQIHVQLNSNRTQAAVFTIINYSGTIVKQQTYKLNSADCTITLPISGLAVGEYFLKITTADGSSVVERFVKIK